jgi:REP element-mobilizing transposase RayT
VRHRERPEHRASQPVHVTIRSAFRPLRHRFVFPTLKRSIAESNRRHADTFRVVQFSVQTDHVHFLVEASDKRSLSAGMRGLAIRIARNVNSLVSRRGRFWADRWHGRALTSARAVRVALVYVLANFRKHRPDSRALVDVYSSAPYFTGFREYRGRSPVVRMAARLGTRALAPPDAPAVVRARTWLLRSGWRQLGALSVHAAPRLGAPVR